MVKITGITPQTTRGDLKAFLDSQCPITFRYTNLEMRGTHAIMTVDASNVAGALVGISGARLGQNKLQISHYHGSKGVVQTGRTFVGAVKAITDNARVEQKLQQVLQNRYNAEIMFLDLKELHKSIKMLGNVRLSLNRKDIVTKLFTEIKTLFPNLVTLSLENNSITHLNQFSHIKQYVPQLLNLSLEKNQIASVHELRHLRQLRLKELMLGQNPCMLSLARGDYHSAVMKELSTVLFIDQVQVREQPEIVILPPYSSSFCDAEATQAIVQSFATKFFTSFDTNRDALADALSDSCAFSINFLKSTQLDMKLNRNLQTISQEERRNKSLHISPANVMTAYKAFNGTTHLLNEVVFDAHVCSLGFAETLCLNIHGSVVVDLGNESQKKLSYDRSLLLAPASPTSPAAAAGWQAVIVNDMLSLKPYLALPVPIS
eukprot:c9018_g1_i2.p1 GENE.c9018_g1_i2~~c9018_g1_i2.p1  ORF type:complete len:498 (-),score=96.56 c9018_g1_i2:186-1481(-)